MSRPTPEELKELTENGITFPSYPNIVIDVYKNRRGKWTQIRIWGHNDLGTCRRKELFVTDIKNNPIEDFRQIDFKCNNEIDLTALEEYYNDGVIPDETKKTNVEILEAVVHQSQIAHADNDDEFFITEAFDNKIDIYKKAKKRSLRSYFD